MKPSFKYQQISADLAVSDVSISFHVHRDTVHHKMSAPDIFWRMALADLVADFAKRIAEVDRSALSSADLNASGFNFTFNCFLITKAIFSLSNVRKPASTEPCRKWSHTPIGLDWECMLGECWPREEALANHARQAATSHGSAEQVQQIKWSKVTGVAIELACWCAHGVCKSLDGCIWASWWQLGRIWFGYLGWWMKNFGSAMRQYSEEVKKTPSGKLEGRIGMSVLFQVAAEQYLLQKHFVNQKSCCESWMQNAEDKSAFDRRGKLITLVMLVLEGVAVALLDAMIFNNVLWLSRVILLRMRFRWLVRHSFFRYWTFQSLKGKSKARACGMLLMLLHVVTVLCLGDYLHAYVLHWFSKFEARVVRFTWPCYLANVERK